MMNTTTKKTYRQQVENTNITPPLDTPSLTSKTFGGGKSGGSGAGVDSTGKVYTNTNGTNASSVSNPTDSFTAPNGQANSFQTADGRVFMGLSPDQINEIATREQQKRQLAVTQSQESNIIAQQQRQAEGQQLVGQVGQINPQPQQQAGVDIGQAIGAGATQGAEYGAVGAVAGLATAGTLSPVGAVVGGVGGFIKGFVTNLKEQKANNIQAEFSNLAKTTKSLRAIVTDTNQGGSASDNIDLFNAQLTLIDEKYSQLRLENQHKLLGKDATTELEGFENFYSVGGGRELLIREMQQSVLNPNPKKTLINVEDLPIE